MSSSTGPGNVEVFTMDAKTWWEVQQILMNEAPTQSDAEFFLKNMRDVVAIISGNATLCQTVLAGNISEAYQILRQQIAQDDSSSILPHEQQDISFFRALRRTQDAWTAPYVGKAEQIFHAAIVDESGKFNDKLQKEFSQDYYAKVMPVVQSSGAGKSRLLDHYSTKHLGVSYTFRTGTQSGYPPGDPEILEVLHSAIPGTKTIQKSMEHATAVALIGSTISERKLNFSYE